MIIVGLSNSPSTGYGVYTSDCPRPDPGDRVQDRQVPGPGQHQFGDALREHLDIGLQRLDVGKHAGQQERVVLPDRRSVPWQLRQIAASSLGQLGQRVRIGHPCDQGCIISRPDTPITSVAPRRERDPASSRTLCSRFSSAVRARISALRYQVRSRSSRIGRGGTKLGRNNP